MIYGTAQDENGSEWSDMKLTDKIEVSTGELLNYIYEKADEVLANLDPKSGDFHYNLGYRNGIKQLRMAILHDLQNGENDLQKK